MESILKDFALWLGFLNQRKMYFTFRNSYVIAMVFKVSPIILPILIGKEVHFVRIGTKINYKLTCEYFPCLSFFLAHYNVI